jgi:hypothetical protein
MFEDLNDDRSHGHEEVAEAAQKIRKTYRGRDPEEFFRLTMREAARMEGHNPKKPRPPFWRGFKRHSTKEIEDRGVRHGLDCGCINCILDRAQELKEKRERRFRIHYFDPKDDSGKRWKTWTFSTIKKARDWRAELGIIWDTPPREIPIQDLTKPGRRGVRIRRNIAPLVVAAAPYAISAGQKYGPRAVKMAKGKMGMNPRKCRNCGCVRRDTGFHREVMMSSTSVSAPCQECIDWVGRGSTRRNTDEDGKINTHNAEVLEVRYAETGTGELFKHKLEQPVRMKKRGGHIIIPPLKVEASGISQ